MESHGHPALMLGRDLRPASRRGIVAVESTCPRRNIAASNSTLLSLNARVPRGLGKEGATALWARTYLGTPPATAAGGGGASVLRRSR